MAVESRRDPVARFRHVAAIAQGEALGQDHRERRDCGSNRSTVSRG
jgi:hypothetical protein